MTLHDPIAAVQAIADRLAAENQRLRDALMCARRHLVTLGGEARLATDDDQIQAQVLFVVDTAVVNSV
jgi:hypothetical protein